MAKSKKQPKKKKRKPSKVKTQNADWKSNWQAKRPVIQFFLLFGLIVLLFYLFYYSDWYAETLRTPLLNFQATISSTLLNWLGFETSVQGYAIQSNAFSINIKNGCDGLEATALFLAAVLVFPLPFKLKVPGLAFGFVTLFIANLLRIVGLFLIGYYWYDAFEFFHLHGGLVLFMVFAILIWFIWINWAFKRQQLATMKL